MSRNIIDKIKSLIFMVTFFLVSCSKDIEKLPVNEQAIYLPSRFSDDIPRDRNRKPLDVLNFSTIQPGMTVVDLLGGGGYYSELFNHIVGEKGKVYLQNNSLFLRFSSEELEQRLANNRLKNVVRLDSEFADMQLPEQVDMIFLGLSFHDLYVKRDDPVITADRDQVYAQLKAALKPGGKIILIDHAAEPGTGISKTKKNHRIDEDWVKQDMASEGFVFVDSIDVLRNPNDDRTLDIWKGKVRNKTDRFIHMYLKPE